MRNEDVLHDALSSVTHAYHLVLDGMPAEGAAYRFLNETRLYESDVVIAATEHFQVYVYRKEYSAELIEKLMQGLRDAGFAVQLGGQSMEEDYYRDEIRASRLKEGNDE